ncbi:Hpt domain-containing protein [Sphingomonas sp. ASV193]|uniref:Hpt domain-containing protein n=1 Tax=Sphingomonas sp. ASV193 TaxID=3144405 RepID=UPI0032E89C67
MNHYSPDLPNAGPLPPAALVDWVHFEKSRGELGPGFIRILGYYREDGVKSLEAIDAAMREHNTVALVLPAHTLKGESRQFGAEAVARVAEKIEDVARFAIEQQRFPDELVPDVVELRRLWQGTIEALDQAVNPLMSRGAQGGGFGKKVTNQSFGRI